MLTTMAAPMVLVLAGLLVGQTASTSVAQLIDQLGSPDFTEREKAAQSLRARGTDALPELRKALEHRDFEVRRRASELIPAIEKDAALRPKLVTLQADRQPVAKVVQTLARQTGYPLSVEPKDGRQRVSVQLIDVPFWQAFETVRRDSGLALHTDLFQEGIQLNASDRRAPFVHLEGPFRLEASHFHEDRDRDFRKPGQGGVAGAHRHLLTLTVSLLAEPRFIFLATEPAVVEEAIDEDGRPLPTVPPPPRKPDNDLNWGSWERSPMRHHFMHHSDVLLQRSSATARIIQRLRGSVPVWIVVQRKPVVVSEKVLETNGLKFQVGGDTLAIRQAEEDGDRFRLAIDVPPDRPGIPINWHKRVRVEDARGKALKSTGSGHTTAGTQRTIMVTYQATENSRPVRLIVEDWTIIHHLIPFEFREVPLP